MRKTDVVIVDNSLLMVAKIIELIEDEAYISTIKACSNYQSAIELIQQVKPGVVLLDINLPGKSGIELLRYIKIHFSETRVIMVSNQSHEQYKYSCLQLGAFHFIDKSKDFQALPSVIASAL